MNINSTLIGQLITFAILLWFTMRYVWPPIIKIIDEREKKIADGIAAAEESRIELLVAKENSREMLFAAKHEAKKIIDQAYLNAEKIIEDARMQMSKEHQNMMAIAQEEIQRELDLTKEELKSKFANLVVAGVEKILAKNIDVDSQMKIIDSIIAEL